MSFDSLPSATSNFSKILEEGTVVCLQQESFFEWNIGLLYTVRLQEI